MSYALAIQDGAKNELREAQAYYLQKTNVAASNFESEITNAIARLTSGTVDYREVVAGVRMVSPTAFPYNIYYRRLEKENTIQVIAILHSKRDPAYVLKRLSLDK